MVLEVYGRSQSFNFGNFNTSAPANAKKSVLFLEEKPLLRKSAPFIETHHKPKTVILEEGEEEEEDAVRRCKNKKVSQKVFKYAKLVWDRLKIKKFSALIILAFYTFLGGYIIYSIEAPIEAKFLAERNKYLLQLQDTLAVELWKAKARWVKDEGEL